MCFLILDKLKNHIFFQLQNNSIRTAPTTPNSAPSTNAVTITPSSSSISAAAMGVNATQSPPGVRGSVSPRSSTPPAQPSSGRCCDSGRPIYTDPATGQTICSCQHEQMLQYQRLAQASLIGHTHGGMQLSMYNSAYPPEGMPGGAYLPGVGGEPPHFYPNVVS